jgi:uncharacterized protein
MKYNDRDLPLLYHSQSVDRRSGQCDCDCACGLDLPSILEACAVSSYFDCDCACTFTATAGSRPHTGDIPYIKSPQVFSLPLDDDWQVTFNPLGPIGLAVLNLPAQQVLDAFGSPLFPGLAAERIRDLAPDVTGKAVDALMRVGLLRPVGETPSLLASTSTLSAWLHVTEACNLSCPYCYVRKRPHRMSAEMGRHAVDRLVETAGRYGYTALKLKYAGGEPVLNFPGVQAVHSRAARCTADNGLALEEVLLTNGVGMTDAMLDWIVEAGMRLMVSLDGGPPTHDRVRGRRDGQSTYGAVVDTVDRALAGGLRPNISITLTALNLEGAEEAVAFALERDLPFNLNFYRECTPAGSPGPGDGPGAGSPLVPEAAQLVAAMLRIFDLIRAYPRFSLPLSNILDRTRLDIPHSHPCSAGRDYLTVDTHGRVAACQMLLEEPCSHLSEADPLAAIRRQGQERFPPVDGLDSCRACPWRTACSGGCPLLRDTVLHDRYCQVYRTLFPELIKLEGYRLLACRS